MTKAVFALAAAALLMAGAAPPAIRPDPDIHHVLGDLCASPDAWNPPFTHVYRLRAGGTIVFVAVRHVTDAKSSTMAQIEAAFARYRPDVVLVEGASSRKSADGAYLEFLADAARKQFAEGHIQENLYAVKLAADHHVAYVGWDISPHDEYIDDIGDGYGIHDAIGAHLLRDHLHPFEAPPPAAIQTELASVPHARQPDGFDFAGWYRGRYGKVYDPTAGTPCGKGIASEIVRSESVRRTLGIVDLLRERAKPGAVVMVEAGANHWLALRDYLQSISMITR